MSHDIRNNSRMCLNFVTVTLSSRFLRIKSKQHFLVILGKVSQVGERVQFFN